MKSCVFVDSKTITMNYLLYLPDDFDGTKKLPLIVFLHGVGESGNDAELLKSQALPRYISQGTSFPAIVLCPQCPCGIVWNNLVLSLRSLIDKICSEYAVDTDRISLTGLSMGGFGTWELAITFPELFTAIAPICGGGFSWRCCALKSIPIWAFHGAKDDVVPLNCSVEMVNAVNRSGGSAELTVFPEAQHNSWDDAYLTTNVIEWLLSGGTAEKIICGEETGDGK